MGDNPSQAFERFWLRILSHCDNTAAGGEHGQASGSVCLAGIGASGARGTISKSFRFRNATIAGFAPRAAGTLG